jgi:vacuolar-type H+-ATPase subunit H
MTINKDGTVDLMDRFSSKIPVFKVIKAKSLDEAINKINEYLKIISKETTTSSLNEEVDDFLSKYKSNPKDIMYENYKNTQKKQSSIVDKADKKLNSYEKQNDGRVTEEVRISDQYKKDNIKFNNEFKKLQDINAIGNKLFKKEQAADRALKRQQYQSNSATAASSVGKSHQRKIALSTLKMSKVGASMMGGMSHKEAVEFLIDDGLSKQKIIDILKKNGHDDKDIKEFFEGVTAASALVAASIRKPSFGSSEGYNYAVNINSLDSNEFYTYPFGRGLNDRRKAAEFIKDSDVKTGYVDTKGKSSLPAVKQYVKENNLKEFYATWKKDSSNYKDDSVDIYYKK